MRQILSTTAAVLALSTAASLAAQSTPAPLPAALISALYGDRQYGYTNYSVGEVPPGYPKALVPPAPARIIGGMANGPEVVAIFDDSTRRLPAFMEELFAQQGYVRPKPAPGSGFWPGFGESFSFCNDSASVSAAPLSGPNRTYARVTFRRGRDLCRLYVQPQQHSETDLTFPELKAPVGVTASGGTGGGADGAKTSNARITGPDLHAAAIVAHYAAQLTAAGWTGDAPATTNAAAAQVFHAKDQSGSWWDGVLIAYGTSTELRALLEMHPRGHP